MKRFALLLILAGSLLAAPWDGARGPFTLSTFTTYAGAAPQLIPNVPETTMILIQCSDSKVSAVRVTITYRAGDGERTATYVTDFYEGHGGMVTTIPRADISTVRVTELREGVSY